MPGRAPCRREPAAEVLVVDGPEASGIDQQPVADDAQATGDDEIDEVAEPAQTRVAPADHHLQIHPHPVQLLGDHIEGACRHGRAEQSDPFHRSDHDGELRLLQEPTEIAAPGAVAAARPGSGRARGGCGDPLSTTVGSTSGGGLDRRSARISNSDAEKSASSRTPRRRNSATDAGPARSAVVARLTAGGAEGRHPVLPAPARAFLDPDPTGRGERVAPATDRTVRRRAVAVQVVVDLPDQPERVVVVAEPDVQTVLLDPTVHAASAGALPTELPALLVHGDLGSGTELLTQPPGSGEPGHPAADDRDPARSSSCGRARRHACASSDARARVANSTAPWRSATAIASIRSAAPAAESPSTRRASPRPRSVSAV